MIHSYSNLKLKLFSEVKKNIFITERKWNRNDLHIVKVYLDYGMNSLLL